MEETPIWSLKFWNTEKIKNEIIYRTEDHRDENENYPHSEDTDESIIEEYFKRLKRFVVTPRVLFFHDTV